MPSELEWFGASVLAGHIVLRRWFQHRWNMKRFQCWQAACRMSCDKIPRDERWRIPALLRISMIGVYFQVLIFRVARFFWGFGKSIDHWWGASTVELAPNASKFATLMRNCLAKTILPPRNWSHCEREGLGIRSCPKLRVSARRVRWYFGKCVENQNLWRVTIPWVSHGIGHDFDFKIFWCLWT